MRALGNRAVRSRQPGEEGRNPSDGRSVGRAVEWGGTVGAGNRSCKCLVSRALDYGGSIIIDPSGGLPVQSVTSFPAPDVYLSLTLTIYQDSKRNPTSAPRSSSSLRHSLSFASFAAARWPEPETNHDVSSVAGVSLGIGESSSVPSSAVLPLDSYHEP